MNQTIWVEDEEYIYLPGKAIGKDNNQTKVEVWLNSKKHIRLLESSNEVTEVKELECPDDLSTLKDINKEYLLYILRRRFEMNNCFTIIAKHLALWMSHYTSSKQLKPNENDTNLIRDFCSWIIKEDSKKKNINVSLSQSMSQSFSQAHNNNINETIVLFGQTMSGKTILSNTIISTLLEMSNDPSCINPSMANSKEMIIQSLQIIELFNQCGQSSKGCLLINLNYDMTHENIVSCKFTPFIMLTNCLTSNDNQDHGVFNIFDMLIETMPNKHKAIYLHKPRANFVYLAQAHATYDCNRQINYTQFIAFIKSLGINDEHSQAFISILMAILYLGNIQFMIDQSNKEVDIHPHSKEDLKAISTLLLIEYNELKKLFIHCKTTSDASLLRNKVVHLLYSKATDWIFHQINHYFNEKEKEYSIQFSHYPEKRKTISIFDSIGYQSSSFNSIDNFIINYSNERIIELFNKKMLSIEQDEYKRESIQWKDIDYLGNSEVLNLFENKGLIDLLDESSSASISTSHFTSNACDTLDDYNKDKSFYTKVYQSYSHNIALGIKSNDFISINHSFGDIHYYINGFIDKNIKGLPQEVYHCFESSTNYSINQILNYNKTTANAESLIKAYKKKIDEFITILSHSNLRFIRCFNCNMVPDMPFNSSIVYSQVMTSNIPQVFSFIKRRFDTKMTFDSFIRRYAFVNKDILTLIRRTYNLSKASPQVIRRINNKSLINCKAIITDMVSILKRNNKLKQSLSNIQIGLTLIYLDDNAVRDLDDTLKRLHCIKTLQRNIIRVIIRRSKAKKIQRAYRAFRKRKHMRLLNEAKQRKANAASRAKSLSAQKVRQKNVLDILKKEQSSLVEAELLQMVKNYQEEINLLREVHIKNEQLRKKNASLQMQVASIENDNDKQKEKKKERESALAPRNSTSKSALALLTEVSALKKKIKEYEIKIETQIISLQQNEHTIKDLKKLNETLQYQVSKRSQSDLSELNQLMERITVIENEKKEYEDKLNTLTTDTDSSNTNSNMCFSARNANEKDQRGNNGNVAEYKKIVLTVKAELKQLKTAYNELKSTYNIEVNKTKALTEQLCKGRKTKYNKESGIGIGFALESRFSIYSYPNKQQQSELKAKDKEIALLRDQLATSLERQEQKNETYQNQLLIVSQELQQRQEYINQLHNTLDTQMENSIQRRKELFNMKQGQMPMVSSSSPSIQYDSGIILKRKDNEINQLRELIAQKEKLFEESCIGIKRKKRVIQKKKEENDLLVLLFKNKKSELQCVEALKYANSTCIKEKLLKVQENEKELIKKVEDLSNDLDYSDDDDDYDVNDNDELIEERSNKFSSEVGSIESFNMDEEQ